MPPTPVTTPITTPIEGVDGRPDGSTTGTATRTGTGTGTVSRRSRRWWLTAAALVIVGAGCIVVGVRGHQHPLAGPANPPASHAARASAARSRTPQLLAARSVPVGLRIPAIGLSVSLSTLGLNLDGTVQVPTDFAQPGWYRLGPSPGQLGSAVILGHVDSYRGPAVFFTLRNLVPGDAIDVTLADGTVADFVVSAVEMYSKAQFPARQVYASHGLSTLQLVTCGGTFDVQTGHYLSNVVVYSALTALTPPANGTAGGAPAAA